MNLSDHFTLQEMTRSQVATRRGIDNTPSPEVVEALKNTAQGLEAVRELLDAPLLITSGYRSLKLNAAINGSATSQHCLGEAADFVAPDYGSPQDICNAIMGSTMDFDQLILEGGWVHISFSEKPRLSILTAHFSNGKTTYTKGIA